MSERRGSVAAGMPDDPAEAAIALLLLDGWRDPYPHYDVLRRVAPVHWSPLLGGWVLATYDAVRSVLRDPRFERGFAYTQAGRGPEWLSRPCLAHAADSLLNLDGAAHTSLRKLVARSFGNKTAESMRARGESIVHQALDRLEAGCGGDLVYELALPLAGVVIAELLGVPKDDRDVFVAHVRQLRSVVEITATPPQLDAADDAVRRLEGYFEGLLADRNNRPAGDLLGTLAEAGDSAPARHVLALAVFLFTAGVENSANALANSLLALAAHPDQFQLLRQEPELLNDSADELLRYDAPVQLTVRSTSEPVEVGGVVIGPCEPVYALLGAANRDPTAFENPGALDFRRTDVRPVAFGGGVHHCVGFALARAEVDWMVRGVVGRFEALAPVGPPVYSGHLTVRGPHSLPLVLGSAAARMREDTFAIPGSGLSAPPTVAPAGAQAEGEASRGFIPPVTDASQNGLPSRPVADRAGGDLAWRSAFRVAMEDRQRTAADLEAVADLFTNLDFFAGCTRTELVGLAATSYPLAFEPGEVICHQSEKAAECYLITEGEVEIAMDDEVIAAAGPDSIIGERGLVVESNRRAASVRATTPVITWAISRDRLERLTRDNPSALAVMRQVVAARYPSTTGE
ncbi:MAG TPA: cytochrome P450 [Acidimicrobiales bacterium]